MGLMEVIGRVLLVVINILFLIVALALTAGGFFLRFGGDLIKQYFDQVMNSIRDSVKENFNGQEISTDNFDPTEMFATVAIALIAAGFILLIISFCGCCGACYKVKCMLMVYVVILIILLIGQIVIVSLIFAAPDTVKGAIKSPLNSLLKNYKGLNGTNVESLGWNFVMQEFDCCGVDDYKDFQTGTDWWGIEEHVTPYACCNNLPTDQASRDACAGATKSTPVTSLVNNNHDKGCVDGIWERLMDQTTLYIAVALGVGGGCQLMVIIFALIIYCNADEKVAPEHQAPPKRHRTRRVEPAW